MDGNKISDVESIFFDAEHARGSKVDHAVRIHALDDLADAIEFGTRSIVDQIPRLQIILRTPVKRPNNRQAVQSI